MKNIKDFLTEALADNIEALLHEYLFIQTSASMNGSDMDKVISFIDKYSDNEHASCFAINDEGFSPIKSAADTKASGGHFGAPIVDEIVTFAKSKKGGQFMFFVDEGEAGDKDIAAAFEKLAAVPNVNVTIQLIGSYSAAKRIQQLYKNAKVFSIG